MTVAFWLVNCLVYWHVGSLRGFYSSEGPSKPLSPGLGTGNEKIFATSIPVPRIVAIQTEARPTTENVAASVQNRRTAAGPFHASPKGGGGGGRGEREDRCAVFFALKLSARTAFSSFLSRVRCNKDKGTRKNLSSFQLRKSKGGDS